MTSGIEDGGPAFPNAWEETNEYGVKFSFVERGLSKREAFAMVALPTVLGLIGIPEDGTDDLWDRSIAERCYALADAMLAARATRST